ncbi:hypothetical protein HDU96_008504 [Phlyctochytrium bullatum]|nr:hypothetical protein HDU96_008504 [Phlyctochytrium bullatum]
MDGLKLIPPNHPILGMRNCNARHSTLLEQAFHSNPLEVVQFLVDRGAAIDPPDIPSADLYFGPPIWSAIVGEFEVFKLILAHSPRLNLRINGSTVLHTAVCQKRPDGHGLDIVRLLLYAGADPTAVSHPEDGHEPLSVLDLAAIMRNYAAMRMLLDTGLDAAATQKALRHACEVADKKAATILIEHGAVVMHPSHRPLLLHVTLYSRAMFDDIATVRLLLQHGALVDDLDDQGRTALHMAMDIATLLLDAGADPMRRCHAGRTVFHFAARWPYPDKKREPLLDRLLGMGVDLNERDRLGRTALHVASECSNTEVLQWLVYKEGIDLYAFDDEGNGWLDLDGGGMDMDEWMEENYEKLVLRLVASLD